MSEAINSVMDDCARRSRLADRFWQKVDKRGPDECWPWVAKAKHKFGYGAIYGGNGNVFLSHWVSWSLEHGHIPSGAHVLHNCDNPACCNPSHLRLGDHQANMRDVKERRRGKFGPKHSPVTVEKIKAGRAANPPKQTEAARESRSEAMRRRWGNEDWRKRFSQLTAGERNHNFGKALPAHVLEKAKENHRSRKGYKHSPETIEKIRQAARRRTPRQQ